jgi:hypothetical protein
MLTTQRWPWLILSCVACREAPPAPAAVSSSLAPAPPAASAPTSGLKWNEATDVVGLRVNSGTLSHGGSLWGVSELVPDPSKTRLTVVAAARGAPLSQLLPAGALAVVNGGYFEADFRPSNWLRSGGVDLAPKVHNGKGGVLALAPGKLYVGPLAGLGFEPELALQSFPLVVESEGKRGIHTDDGRRAARTLVCLSDGRLHLIVIAAPRGDGPTLFETAELLRKPRPEGFGCRVALNLDGGPSSGVWFGPAVPAKQRLPFSPVGHGIAIVPG